MTDLSNFPSIPSTPQLSPREKAAIVVRLLLSQGAVPALAQLPETKQTELAVQIARMAPVDKETVATVADEFATEIERIALSFPQGLDGAIGLLSDVLSEGATTRLRQMAPSVGRNDAWEAIDRVEADRIVPYLEAESTEVSAVILSKLSVGKAADILGLLPGELARRITYAISRTEGVSPSVVNLIGASMAEQLDARPVTAFPEGPVTRVGEILNNTPAAIRNDVLAGIESEDQPFAEEVRAAIFTFSNIPDRIATRDIPRIQRDLAQDDLAVIVAAASGNDQAAIEYILENISKRMAESIRDEGNELVDVKPDDAEAAMMRVVAVIRELETAGEVFFVAKEG